MTLTATTWTPTRELAPIERARQELLRQHGCIRYLLDSGLGIVAAAIDGDERAALRLPSLFSATHEMLQHHLTAEETLLLPFLEDDPPSGPRQAERLRDEHNRQRQELEVLMVVPALESVATLARTYRNLGIAIIADMEAEEEHLLNRPDASPDEPAQRRT